MDANKLTRLCKVGGIILVYAISFIEKKQKGILDIIKLIWIALAYTGYSLESEKWFPKQINYLTIAFFV